MAGPGIRYARLAQALAAHVETVLAAPEGSETLPGAPFEQHTFQRGRWDTLAPALARAGVVVAPPDIAGEFPQLPESGACVAIDGYNPLMAEWLSTRTDVDGWRVRRAQLQAQFVAGDFYLCASERQRDWWLGLLEAHGRINPVTIADDRSLRKLIDVVPYGLTPSAAERPRTPMIKGVWPGVSTDDRLLVWGGGLWLWLDPLTAIHAAAKVAAREPRLRLAFPGTRHPNPDLAALPTHLDAARALSARLGILNTHVLFGDWMPYDRWPDVLAETDVALSLHHDTFETRLAFRSRMLEYFGARVPVVATRGDATAELIERYALGETVPESDPDAVAAAIERLLHTPRAAFEPGWQDIQRAYSWDQAAQPLIRYCLAPWRAADRALARAEDATTPPSLDALREENRRLRALVTGYEQGRFMRLMRWLRKSGA